MVDEVTPTTRKEYKKKKKWLKNEKAKNIATTVSLLGVLSAVTGYALHKPIDYNGLTPKIDVTTTAPSTTGNENSKGNSEQAKSSTPSNSVKKVNKDLENKVKKTDEKIRKSESKAAQERAINAKSAEVRREQNNPGGGQTPHILTPPTVNTTPESTQSNNASQPSNTGDGGAKNNSSRQKSTANNSKAKAPATSSSGNSTRTAATTAKSTPSTTSNPSSTTVSTINLVLDANYVADKSQIVRSGSRITPPANYDFRAPVSTKLVSSQYGYNSMRAFHSGIDYKVNCGEAVYASADGVVENVGDVNSYGKRIVIKHTGNVYSTYSQLSEIKVNVGDHIKAGQNIGNVGVDGSATTCELHFETLVNGSFINPLNYINHKVTGEQSIIKTISVFYGPNYKPSASSSINVTQK